MLAIAMPRNRQCAAWRRQVRNGLRLLLVLHLSPVAISKCPNWCSQHGICTGPGDDAFCICEMGFQGDDCAIRLCPKGDDPLTTDQADRALLLRTSAEGGMLSGELSITFNGETTILDADARRTGDQECASALQALPNIDRVTCSRSAVSEFGGADYLISLLSFPTMPWENNHYSHFGNPSLDAFSCNISSGADTGISPSCELIDVITENVKEYTECSQHGRCVRETGRCECSFGFRGEACDDISDPDDVQVLLAEGPFFTGSVLKLRANRGFSPDFDLIRAIAGPHDAMTLTGAGDLILHGGAVHIQPPPSIYPGSRARAGAGASYSTLSSPSWGTAYPPKALTVSGGSLDVRGGGAAVRSTRANSAALSVSVGLLDQDNYSDEEGLGGARHFSYSGTALAVNIRQSGSGVAEAEDFQLLELSIGGQQPSDNENESGNEDGNEEGSSRTHVLFSVRGDGRVSMAGGGGVIVKAGNLEVSQGDATFKGDVEVGRTLGVGSGGVSVADGGSVRVADGGFEVSMASSTTSAPGGKVEDGSGNFPLAAVGVLSASHRDFAGDVLRIDAGGAEAAASGAVLLRATSAGQDVFDIKASGATSIKSGGLDVEAGGLKVGSGGVVVSSGGLTVDGGLLLRSGTLTIGDGSGGDAGFEVAHGGIRTISRDASTSALSASTMDEGFAGAVLAVSAPASAPSRSFRLLQATVGGGTNAMQDDNGVNKEENKVEEVFYVDGTGRVTAVGGLMTGATGSVVAQGKLIAQGSTVLERKQAVRVDGGHRGKGGPEDEVPGDDGGEGDGVEVNASLGTFFEVPDDGREGSANNLRIKGEARAGQIMMLRNGDADPTSGDAVIPPGYTVLFIHDGSSWRDVRALEAAVRELHGVTSLSAAADLDIGEFSLKARHLVSTGTEAGGVAFFGGGGLITSDKGLSWNAQTGTLTVPRLQALEVAESIDFKGKSARNLALINTTIDFIPFLKTARIMLEGGRESDEQQVASATSRALAIATQSTGQGYGLAVFDKKGELSRAAGVTVLDGGLVDVRGLGPHLQHGDVDFQGHTARNLSLSGVRAISDLHRLQVRDLFISAPNGEDNASHNRHQNAETQVASPSSLAVLTNEGALRSAGEAFSVDPRSGVFLAPRIGPHEVTGEVDFLGNLVRNGVLESPEIRGTVPSLHVKELTVSARSSVSRGYLALFSSEASNDPGERGSGNPLGLASGGGGLAWRDGALQNVKLGGTTTLEGDLDLRGHRLLNFDFGTPDLDHIEDLTIRNSLKLDKHKGASSAGTILVVGADGRIGPADPTTLNVHASSASVESVIVSGKLSCRGDTNIEGNVSINGAASIDGEVKLMAGLDARGTHVANARLESAKFVGAVQGDVDFDGAINLRALRKNGTASGRLVVVGDGGELRVAPGLELDEENGVLGLDKVSGHEVMGSVNFRGHPLVSPAIDFTAGGGVIGLASLSVGDAGLDVSGVLSAASDVMVEGSVTVAGAVMGRGPYMDTSDARVKVDVREISAADASAVVKGLRAVTYALKPDAFPSSRAGDSQAWAAGGRRELGFIAQEVEHVAPEVVAEDSNGYKAVAYSRLVPTLASALSAALHRLDKLEESESAPTATTNGEAPPSSTTAATYPSIQNAASEEHFAGSARGQDNGRRSARKNARRATEVGVHGAQQGESDSEHAMLDLMQLWVENTALRGQVGEMEKKMAELDRKLADLASVGVGARSSDTPHGVRQ